MNTATKPSRVGRPRKLDYVKRREIVALITAGWSKARAAAYVGCSLRTVLNEAKRNSRFRRDMNVAEQNRRRAHAGETITPGMQATPDHPAGAWPVSSRELQRGWLGFLKRLAATPEAEQNLDLRAAFKQTGNEVNRTE